MNCSWEFQFLRDELAYVDILASSVTLPKHIWRSAKKKPPVGAIKECKDLRLAVLAMLLALP